MYTKLVLLAILFVLGVINLVVGGLYLNRKWKQEGVAFIVLGVYLLLNFSFLLYNFSKSKSGPCISDGSPAYGISPGFYNENGKQLVVLGGKKFLLP